MKIVLVEDNPEFAQALAHLITTRGPYEVEVSLPGRSGIWLAKALRAIRPSLPILMISGHQSKPYVEDSLQPGARGYVLKEDAPGILEGIRAAMNGCTYIRSALQ